VAEGKIRTSNDTETESEGWEDQSRVLKAKMDRKLLKERVFNHLLEHTSGRKKLEIEPGRNDKFLLKRTEKRTGDNFVTWTNEFKKVWDSMNHIHMELVKRAIDSINEIVPHKVQTAPAKHNM
jgi:hypothetical protein